MAPIVRDAILELLGNEPLTDNDLLGAYRTLEAERGWPPAAAATILVTRGRLTRSGRVSEVGTVIGPTGRPRKLWTAAQ